ncbi:MAG TPA: hypothetical protein VJB94_05855 [Candidatus Nanoarchaeia archaeon]|nr:hypothetical protein [Candidatus Nanoarchaeia archaeon]
MVPKLKFGVINFDGMIKMINSFLLHSGNGFDWSGVYAKEYPEFGKLMGKIHTSEETKRLSEDFFRNIYDSRIGELTKISKDFQKEWDKNGEELLIALSKVVEKEWPADCKEIKAWISLNPICPRFLEKRAFDLYWRFSPDKMKVVALHEILHFIWFEKWKEIFPKYRKEEFENPHLVWKLSEMVPLSVLNDNRIQDIFKHEPSVYNEWKFKQIERKPLLEHLQEIYNKRSSFADFMKKSWKFVKKHEKEIHSIK